MKAFRFIAVGVLVYLILCGSSPKLVSVLSKFGIFKDELHYRDLYKKTNLPQFLDRYPDCILKNPTQDSIKLHIIGDSFMEQLIEESKPSFDNWDFTYVLLKRKLKLDTSKKNIMLIAMVERNARNRFKLKLDNYNPEHRTEDRKAKSSIGFFKEDLFEDAFLTSPILSKIREFKATLNYKLFGYYASSTKLINQGTDVVYIDDIKEEEYAKHHFGNEEQATISRNLEYIEASYKKLGFDRVIFSVLPNKNTIYNTNIEYSGLIEKLESSNVDFLKVHDAFKNQRYYYKDDTHWNCAGRTKFLELLAAKLDEK